MAMFSLVFLTSLGIFFFHSHSGNSSPLMGPAEVLIKFTEKCKMSLPSLIDMDLKLYSRRGKVIFQINSSFPYKVSDDLGYAVNVAVKRSGAWKPNFMKLQGAGICSFAKDGAPDFFKTLAEELKVPEPAKCPLPSGMLNFNYSHSDPTAALSKFGMNVMPYGEFRLSTNITHKGNVIYCMRCFVDLVPKKSRG